MSRKAARAIVLKEDSLLVMHRNKFGQEYETLPGGGIEIGESVEDALRREIKEETSIEIGGMRLVFVESAGDPYGDQFIYVCEYISGEPRLADDSEEAQINKLGQNLYDPKWLRLSELPQSTFLSERLKQAIIAALDTGFPAEPVLL